MSVDYKNFMESKSAQLKHLQEVYRGEADEQELDHSQQIVTLIPNLLKSPLSQEIRSLLLRHYSEIRGTIRDQNLSLLSRADLYAHAAEAAELEEAFAAERGNSGDGLFKELIGYLDTETQEALNKTIAEHELFKSQMADVVKSYVGMSSEDVVGPREIKEFDGSDKDF